MGRGLRRMVRSVAVVQLLVELLVVQEQWVGARSDKSDTVSQLNDEKFEVAKERRYLLYEVNPGEGLNLRRDVHMRVANLVRVLRERGENWILVLPPFGQSFHWRNPELRGRQESIPWGLWFDLDQLSLHVPSIEFTQYMQETGQTKKVLIDQVFYLQHYAEGWGDGWEEKWHYRPCIEAEGRFYQKDTAVQPPLWRGYFWGYPYSMVGAARMDCISIMGQSSTLANVLLQPNLTSFRTVMVDRAETILHDHFGDTHYWAARRSIRYSAPLRALADHYRASQLDSDDERDRTPYLTHWTDANGKAKPSGAIGGPYLAVHWRRKDFVRSHGKEIPSIKGTAQQITALLDKLNLDTVFIGTDGKPHEVDELRAFLPTRITLKQYAPPKDVLEKYLDGGISIIDQWIMVHARYFIGTHVSTFSFRVQDDREILGFDPDTTFNRLCPDSTPDCEQPAKWKLVL